MSTKYITREGDTGNSTIVHAWVEDTDARTNLVETAERFENPSERARDRRHEYRPNRHKTY